MKNIGIIMGDDAVKFKKNMENPEKISVGEKNRIKENYTKIKKLEYFDKDNETTQEKIRNQLSPYWNIVSILDIFDSLTEDKKAVSWAILKKELEVIKKHQDELLTLIDSTYEEKIN